MQNTTSLVSGSSDFRKMKLAILKLLFKRINLKKLFAENLKNFELNKFKNKVRTKMKSMDNYRMFKK